MFGPRLGLGLGGLNYVSRMITEDFLNIIPRIYIVSQQPDFCYTLN